MLSAPASAGDSKSGAEAKASAPEDDPIVNSAASAPPAIENTSVGDASGSVAVTVCTAVVFSTTDAVPAEVTVGPSFALVRSIVIVAVSEAVEGSVTVTVSEKLGVVSKSSAALLATVIWPLPPSIANAVPVSAKASVSRSTSLATTDPTTVPFAAFSATEKPWSFTTGASFTGVIVSDAVAGFEVNPP